MIEDILKDIIRRFNEKASTDGKMKSELAGMERKVLIKLDDGRVFHFLLSNGQAGELMSGSIEDSDISIESDEQTLEGLYKGEIRAMKALALKKVRVKSTLEDMLRLRRFF